MFLRKKGHFDIRKKGHFRKFVYVKKILFKKGHLFQKNIHVKKVIFLKIRKKGQSGGPLVGSGGTWISFF